MTNANCMDRALKSGTEADVHTKRKAKEKKRSKILLLAPVGADDLLLSLKAALKDGQLFDFELMEEALPVEQLTLQARILAKDIERDQPNMVVLCDGFLSRLETVFELIRERHHGIPIIVAARFSDPEVICRFLDTGAADFITPPFRSIDLIPRLWRLRNRNGWCDPVLSRLKEKLGLTQLVGESPRFAAEIKKIPAVARCAASVFISGETGTGKELFARAIHHLSPRSAKPFVPVNCGAIPVDLVENELFGHESGAFTGANSSCMGVVQSTDGGSLFLDEVDCLPLTAQVKLLRFLQEKEIRPLGAIRSRRVDVRLIAASNANLLEAVQQGRFRQDLFFRLNVIVMTLPPLRERKEDIPVLARHFVAKCVSALGTPTPELTATALDKLKLYDWPGNIRELENVIERSVVLCPRSVLEPEDIQLPLRVEEGGCFQTAKAKVISEFERAYLQSFLPEHDGNITAAAMAAGKDRRAFWHLMRKHHISPNSLLRS